jgi:hypothetical protein
MRSPAISEPFHAPVTQIAELSYDLGLDCALIAHPSLSTAAEAVSKMLENNVSSIAVTRRGRFALR